MSEEIIQLLYDMEDYLVGAPDELQDRLARTLDTLESEPKEPKVLAVVEGWMTQRHLNREDTNALCIWQFPEGQDKECMSPVTATIAERKV